MLRRFIFFNRYCVFCIIFSLFIGCLELGFWDNINRDWWFRDVDVKNRIDINLNIYLVFFMCCDSIWDFLVLGIFREFMLMLVVYWIFGVEGVGYLIFKYRKFFKSFRVVFWLLIIYLFLFIEMIV